MIGDASVMVYCDGNPDCKAQLRVYANSLVVDSDRVARCRVRMSLVESEMAREGWTMTGAGTKNEHHYCAACSMED
jgi:hypothetical protein